MVKQISTDTVIIHGKQGGGKTIFAVLLASGYVGRIFSNVDIYKGRPNQPGLKEKVNVPILNTSFLKTLSYSSFPGCIVFDEMGLNFNSKEHSTAKNKELSKFFFLVRKYNLSSFFVSQRFSSVPIDMRELCDLIYEVRPLHRSKKHPLFIITRQTCDQEGILNFEEEYVFDIIEYLEKIGISYNTLESSIIE